MMESKRIKRKAEGESSFGPMNMKSPKANPQSSPSSIPHSSPQLGDHIQLLPSTSGFASREGDSKLAHASYLSSFPLRPVSSATRSYDGDYYNMPVPSKKAPYYPQTSQLSPYYYPDVADSSSSASSSVSPVSPPLSPQSSPLVPEAPDTPPPLTSSAPSASPSSSYYYHANQVHPENDAFLYPHSNQSQYSYAQSDASRSNYSLQYYPFPQQYSQLQHSSASSNFSSQPAPSNRNYTGIDVHSMSKLKVPQLKSLLGQYHLKKSGKKQELIDRLASYLQSTGTPFSTSSVINNWPRKKHGDMKGHLDIMAEDSSIWSNNSDFNTAHSPMQTVLPATTVSSEGLSFIMPAPLHSDALGKHPTVVCRFESSPILIDESCQKMDTSASLGKHFSVYYQRDMDKKHCLHHLYLIPQSPLHLELIQHRELFAYGGEGYEPAPLCPLCSGYAETWHWDLRRKSSKSESNPLLKWISQHLNIDSFIKPVFGGKLWEDGRSLARICKAGHLTLSVTETSHPNLRAPRLGTQKSAFSPRRRDQPHSFHVDLEDVTGSDSILGMGQCGIERLDLVDSIRFEEIDSISIEGSKGFSKLTDDLGDVTLW